MKKRFTLIRNNGFTLAEVLVVLAIIGVVAAICIPSIVNKTQKQEEVVALKKAYSSLSQAAEMVQANNGSLANAFSSLSSDTDSDGMKKIFTPFLKVQKDCGTAATGCFADKMIKWLDNSNFTNLNTASTYSKIITTDGMSVSFVANSKDCIADKSVGANPSSAWYNSVCGDIWVDIDGAGKGPNTVGRDLFDFFVTQKGIYPRGLEGNDSYTDGNCPGKGGGCAYNVLKDGAMNY